MEVNYYRYKTRPTVVNFIIVLAVILTITK